MIGTLAGVAVAGIFVAVFSVLLGGEFSFPPTRRQCASFWNGVENEPVRTRVADESFGSAVVEGWEAKGVHGYCSIAFLAGSSGGRWAFYVSWVSGESFPGAARRWSLDTGGRAWGVDGPYPATSPNASVHRDGYVRLWRKGS
jgi:hypothetical protein